MTKQITKIEFKKVYPSLVILAVVHKKLNLIISHLEGLNDLRLYPTTAITHINIEGKEHKVYRGTIKDVVCYYVVSSNYSKAYGRTTTVVVYIEGL